MPVGPASGEEVVRVEVREDGSVGDVRIVEQVADLELDDLALVIARIMEFSPGSFDGFPVTVWSFMPINIRGRAPR
jgi:TonB family protein